MYWVDVHVGSQRLPALLDMRSVTTSFVTTRCVDKGSCFRTDTFPRGYYNHTLAGSAEAVRCSCSSSVRPCADSDAVPGTRDACLFEQTTSDGTSNRGGLYEDTIRIGDVSAPVRFVAVDKTDGGESDASPKLETGSRFGLLPYSRAVACSPSCADAAAVNLSHSADGITLRLGADPPEIVFEDKPADAVQLTPITTIAEQEEGARWYTVCLGGIEIDRVEIGTEFLESFGSTVVIDASDPYIVLADPLCDEFQHQLQKGRCNIPGMCGSRSVFHGGWMWEADFQKAKSHLPNVSFMLDGITAILGPDDYFVSEDDTARFGGPRRILGFKCGARLPWLLQDTLNLVDFVSPTPLFPAVDGGGLTVLGSIFIRAFEMHLNPRSGVVSLRGANTTTNRGHTCATSSGKIPGWWLPVAALSLGLFVVVLIFGVQLAGGIAGILSIALCLTAASVGVALFWQPQRIALDNALQLSLWYFEGSLAFTLLVALIICMCKRRRAPVPRPDTPVPPVDHEVARQEALSTTYRSTDHRTHSAKE